MGGAVSSLSFFVLGISSSPPMSIYHGQRGQISFSNFCGKTDICFLNMGSLMPSILTAVVCLLICQQVLGTQRQPHGGQERAYGGNAGSTGGSTNGSTNGSCGLPSVIAKSVPTDKEAMVGTWYQYMKKDRSSATRNKVLQNTVIGRTYYPGTNRPAVMLDQKIIITNRDLPCFGRYAIILGTLDGVSTHYRVQTDRTINPTLHELYHLYMDPSSPDGLAIHYECVKPNFNTNICDDFFIYIDVRTNPNQMTAAQKDAKNKIINDTLKPYCLSTADVQLVTFDNDLEACQPPRPEIYDNMIAGFNATLPVRP